MITSFKGKPNGGRHRIAGALLAGFLCLVLVAVAIQFYGGFTPTTRVTMMAARAGLLMEVGSKVTFNGVFVGRVARVDAVTGNGPAQAKLDLDIRPRYVPLMPANVDVSVTASTVFGNKHVALQSPEHPVAQRLHSGSVIDATAVTTEFNTLFETILKIAEQVDPVKLNATLTATADSLRGLGTTFGRSIADANAVLADINPRMPQLRYDIQRFADLTDIYSQASPQLWSALDKALTTVHTLNEHRGELDAALLAAIGMAGTGTDVLDRSEPYLVRALADLVPTAQLLDEYSPEIFCAIRNYHDAVPGISSAIGGNGYSALGVARIVGAENAYVYPDNLPRVNAKGGPGGRPGCWHPISKDLWPAPYLVADTGASLAPYDHFEFGKPLALDYVWGRQIGENTINP